MPDLAPFTYASPLDWFYIIVGGIISAAGGITMPYFLSCLGDMMDAMSGMGQKKSLSYYAVLQLVLGAIAWGCCLTGVTLLCWAAEHQIQRMSSLYMNSLLRQDLAWIDQQVAGKLAARAAAGVNSIRHSLGIKIGQICFSVTFAIGGFAISLARNWKLGLVVACMIPVNLLAFGTFFMALGWAGRIRRASYEGAAAVLEECMLTLRTVVSFGLETRFTDLFYKCLADAATSLTQASCWSSVAFAACFGCFYVAEALGFWYGAKLISDDIDAHGADACTNGRASCTSGGEVLAVFMTFIQGIFALAQCPPSLGAIAAARSAMLDFTSVITRKTEIEIDDPEAPSFPDTIDGRVEFKNVTFKYPSRPDNLVYADLSLNVQAGKSVALVGSSGCGKSTMVQLLQRFYDVDAGSIEVDGHNIREYNLTSLRKHMALVSQEPRLFATSILENIRIGKLDATDAECEAAARQANAHNFIKEFPKGYNTFVGEGGGQLSGGQKQRIAIARAILRNPAILILDEATSALDNESEKVVQQALDKLLEQQKRTTLIIAHRLSTIRNADLIAVFDKISDSEGAQIVELGSHDELMALDGIYTQLVKAQDLQVVQEAAQIATNLVDMPRRGNSVAGLIANYSKDGGSSANHLTSRSSRDISKFVKTPGCCGGKKGQDDQEELANVSLGRQLSLLTYFPGLSTLSIIFGAIDGAFMPCYVILFASFMSTFYLTDTDELRSNAREMAMWLGIMGASAWLITSVRLGSSLVNVDKVSRTLRVMLFNHIIHTDIGFFDDPQKAGSSYLSDVLAADPPAAAAAVCSNIPIMITALSAIITALIVSMTASIKLAAVALGAFVFVAPAMFLESQLTIPNIIQAADLSEAGVVDIQTTSYVLLESLQNFRTVQAYSLQPKLGATYTEYIKREKSAAISRGILSGGAWGLSQFLQFATQALIFWYGGRLVTEGSIGVSGMVRGSMAIMMAAANIGTSAFYAGDAAAGKRGLSRIFALLDRHSLADARDPSGKEVKGIDREIEIKDLVFYYPMRPDKAVYKNLTFTISRGETVALVGASGCGKSTVVQLLQRFYVLDNDAVVNIEGSPTHSSAGEILVDGSNLQALNLKSWRKCIGMVQQEPLLFTTTVRENIALGNFEGDCSDEIVEWAAKMANAHDFISLFDHGYETHVGTRGGQLSGGQKQRVAIARALIRNPAILILDEATSALDAESEKIVQAALDKVIEEGQRTTIVIAHRLSTIRKADKIIVLKNEGDGSTIVEFGKHEELVQDVGGVYYNLAKLAALT